MKTVSSKTEKTVVADLGRFRHVVSYTADDTDPKAVKVVRLEDSVVNLAAPGVAGTPKGKLAYDGVSIKAEEIDICPCFASIVEDLKAVCGAIEHGEPLPDRAFPAEGQAEKEEKLEDRED